MLLRKGTILVVLFVLLAGIMAASVNAASANQSTNQNTTTYADGYTATPIHTVQASQSAAMDSSLALAATGYSITQGQQEWFNTYIGPGCTGFDVNLNWGNPSNSLQLTIFAPNGAEIGPFTDGSDGVINGDIDMYISNYGGSMPVGTYYCQVYGLHVTGAQQYSFQY